MKRLQTSVIYVNFNSLHWVRDSIRSILDGHDPSLLEFIVVSNSPWGVADPQGYLRQTLPELSSGQLQLQLAADNPGFSAANNRGAALASGEYLFFLNPDTTVAPGSIDTLTTFLEQHPGAGAVGPETRYEDGSLQYSIKQEFSISTLLGLLIPLPQAFTLQSVTHVVYDRYHTQPVDVVNGSAILTSRTVFDAVGGFDDGYFLYFEEDDLCLRIRQAGYQVWFVQESAITHYEGKSSERMYVPLMVELNRSKRRFLAKFKPETLDTDLILCRLAYSLRWLFNLVRGNTLKAAMYHALTRFYFEDCYFGDTRILSSTRKLQ